MILNYHHRMADTHNMPEWVSISLTGVFIYLVNKQTSQTLSTWSLLQVSVVFLQWLPWLLKMGRPGEKITRKTIMMAKKMKELDIKETSSKSLLSNVLDMDDDFRRSTLPRITAAPQIPHPSHVKPSQNNQGILRWDWEVVFVVCVCPGEVWCW